MQVATFGLENFESWRNFGLKIKEKKALADMPSQKRPAAKTAAKQPAKAKKREMTDAEIPATQPSPVDEPEELDNEVPEGVGEVKEEVVTPHKAAALPQPAKASAKAQAKPEPAKALPAPPKNAWVDVRNQLQALAKKGNTELQESFKKAKDKGRMAQREWYYQIFLLDPDVAVKEIHKESQEKVKTKETTKKGWITPFQYGIFMGLDKSDPDFADDCLAACKGLPQREHENPELAKKGKIQVYAEIRDMDEDSKVNSSLTKAHQRLQNDQVENESFQRVEEALMVNPPRQQLMLGSKAASKPAKAPEMASVAGGPKKVKKVEEDTVKEEYKKFYAKLKSSVNGYGNHISSAEMFLETLKNSTASTTADGQQLNSIVATLDSQIQAAQVGKQKWVEAMGKKMMAAVLRDQCAEDEAKQKIQEVNDMRALVEQEVASFKKNWGLQKQLAATLSLQ